VVVADVGGVAEPVCDGCWFAGGVVAVVGRVVAGVGDVGDGVVVVVGVVDFGAVAVDDGVTSAASTRTSESSGSEVIAACSFDAR
jgi:hypothetical protein